MTPESRAVLDAASYPDLDAAVAAACDAGAHLLIARGTPPPSWADHAGRILDSDMGVASVSLADRAVLDSLAATGTDEPPASRTMATADIRDRLRGAELSPLSVPGALGAASVLGYGALTRVGPLPSGADVAARLDRWSALAGSRAFCHLLLLDDLAEDDALDAPASTPAPDVVADAPPRIRVALRGITVHIDGRTLEAAETGTEVHTVNLIRALAARPEIAGVNVSVRGALPPYAADLPTRRGISVFEGCGEWRDDLPAVDVFHRPYQPLSREDCALWRTMATRTACHMQDLITYLSPQYHPSTVAWAGWRERVAGAVASVDGLFTLSDYVRDQVLREGLRADPDLVWAAGCGVDHVLVGGTAQPPPELGDAPPRFALVLGSTYGHKNVDLATAAVAAVRERGLDLVTVTAGREVDAGEGAAPRAPLAGTVAIGRNVASAERDWLVANAAVVVFATSAEGFGLVPFEAAAYGTPTVCVSFGSLAEQLGPVPVAPADWSVGAFADAIATVVADPEASRAQVEAIRAAARRHTWDATAGVVLRGYREILRRPATG